MHTYRIAYLADMPFPSIITAHAMRITNHRSYEDGYGRRIRVLDVETRFPTTLHGHQNIILSIVDLTDVPTYNR